MQVSHGLGPSPRNSIFKGSLNSLCQFTGEMLVESAFRFGVLPKRNSSHVESSSLRTSVSVSFPVWPFTRRGRATRRRSSSTSQPKQTGICSLRPYDKMPCKKIPTSRVR